MSVQYLAVFCDVFLIVQCFWAWLLAVCVLVKVSQGSQNLRGLAFCATTVYCVTSLCHTSLCQGRFWKPIEVNKVADKFCYVLTRTCWPVQELRVSTYILSREWGSSAKLGKLNKNSFLRLLLLLLLAPYHERSIPGSFLRSFCDSSVLLGLPSVF